MMNPRREALHKGINQLRDRTEVFAATVAPLYLLLGWTWLDNSVPPTAKQIGAALEELLDKLWDAVNDGELDEQDHYYHCTGGLEAGYAGGGQFLLSFRLEEWVEMSAVLFEMPGTDV